MGYLLVGVLGGATLVTRRRGGGQAAVFAGMAAGSTGALLILQVVLALSTVGPARLIPDLVPMASSPADDLANSRVEIQDPHMWLLLVGWLIAVGQCVVSLASMWFTARRSHPRPAG